MTTRYMKLWLNIWTRIGKTNANFERFSSAQITHESDHLGGIFDIEERVIYMSEIIINSEEMLEFCKFCRMNLDEQCL